jgi:hypothetical protein
MQVDVACGNWGHQSQKLELPHEHYCKKTSGQDKTQLDVWNLNGNKWLRTLKKKKKRKCQKEVTVIREEVRGGTIQVSVRDTVVCSLEPILLLANLGRKFKAFGSNIITTLLLEVAKCGYFRRNVWIDPIT